MHPSMLIAHAQPSTSVIRLRPHPAPPLEPGGLTIAAPSAQSTDYRRAARKLSSRRSRRAASASAPPSVAPLLPALQKAGAGWGVKTGSRSKPQSCGQAASPAPPLPHEQPAIPGRPCCCWLFCGGVPSPCCNKAACRRLRARWATAETERAPPMQPPPLLQGRVGGPAEDGAGRCPHAACAQ